MLVINKILLYFLDRQLCSHASSVCFYAESLFPGHQRDVEPCLGRCPQPARGTKKDGVPAIFGAKMDPT